MTDMTLRRLSDLLAAYGARPERWPEAERESARALLARSDVARTEYDAARHLDAALDSAPALTPSVDLEARILAAAPKFAAAGGATRTRAAARRRPGGRRRVVRSVAAVALATAAAVALWMRVPESEAPRPVTVELSIAELGSYEMPSDALLGSLDDDLAAALPALGCDESGLGCLDAEPTEDVGARPTRRMRV